MTRNTKILISIVVGSLLLFIYVAPNLINRIPGLPRLPERPFTLGLDLLGGVHLQYKADLSNIGTSSPGDALAGVRDVIERRVSRGRARGKIFWGCNRYPKCDYASWTNPLKTEPENKNTT